MGKSEIGATGSRSTGSPGSIKGPALRKLFIMRYVMCRSAGIGAGSALIGTGGPATSAAVHGSPTQQLFILVIVILFISYNLVSVATDTYGQLSPLKFSNTVGAACRFEKVPV
jgi:hypothetical protein